MGTTLEQETPRDASSSEMKLLEMPPVSESLPITFEDTGFKMSTLEFTCGHCGADIPTNKAFGSVSHMIPSVVDLDLLGMCPSCNIATPFRIRVHSNRIVDWRDENGDWQSYTVYAPNRHGIKHSLRDLIAAIKERFVGPPPG